MKNCVVIVGSNVCNDHVFVDYLIRESKKILGQIDTLMANIENPKEILFELEEIIKKHTVTLIFASKKNHSTIARMLATLNNDTLEAKENQLLPSKTSVYDTNTFLVTIREHAVNLLEVTPRCEIPQILVESEVKQGELHLFGIDHQSAELLLKPISEMYNAMMQTTEIIEGWTKISVTCTKYGGLSKFIDSTKSLFGSKVIATTNIAAYIIERLKENNKTITFAESCTGGLLSYFFTKESGSSAIFNGSVITYADSIKRGWLEVSAESLYDYGAVSEYVVSDMLKGVLKISGADYALAISGVAGPSGGTQTKPVGTVFVGVAKRDSREIISRERFFGDRNYIQQQAVYRAIMLLVELAENDLS